jgi:hypothetical protein
MALTASQRRGMLWGAVALCAVFLLWLLGPVLTPFIVAAVLAYALHPAVEPWQRRRVPRLLAVVVVEALAIVALLALAAADGARDLEGTAAAARADSPPGRPREPFALPWLAQFGIHVSLDSASIKAFVLKYLDANIEDWLGHRAQFGAHRRQHAARADGQCGAGAGGAVLPAGDWPQLVSRVQGAGAAAPARAMWALGFLDECDVVLGQYLRGQLLVMGALAAVLQHRRWRCSVSTWRCRWACSPGLAIFIPYLGFGLGLALALLAGVLQFASPGTGCSPPVYLWGPRAAARPTCCRRWRTAAAGGSGGLVRRRRRRCPGRWRRLVAGGHRPLRIAGRRGRPGRLSRCSSKPRRRACSGPLPAACRRWTCRCATTCAPAWAGAMCLRCSRLSEAETRAVLRREADRRGIFLSDEVMDLPADALSRDLGT